MLQFVSAALTPALRDGGCGVDPRAAARGETVLAPPVATRLVDRSREAPELPRLSERGAQVLRLVAEGCTDAETGRRLLIGESAVKTHLLRVFGKLGVSDRTAAVTRPMCHGCCERTRKARAVGPGVLPPAPRSRLGQPRRFDSSATTPASGTASCSPDSMSLSWTTPSARSRSPATRV